jgi:phenylalanyl-tRNA synthetase beta chain
VGRFGTLHPDVSDALELDPGAGHVAALDLAAVETLGSARARFLPIPRLPAVTRDIAVEAPEALRVGDLREAIETSAGDLCESVELFDVFRPEAGEPRSLAFRLVYRDPKATTDPERARTLTDKEVDARQAKVVARVTEMGALLRA